MSLCLSNFYVDIHVLDVERIPRRLPRTELVLKVGRRSGGEVIDRPSTDESLDMDDLLWSLLSLQSAVAAVTSVLRISVLNFGHVGGGVRVNILFCMSILLISGSAQYPLARCDDFTLHTRNPLEALVLLFELQLLLHGQCFVLIVHKLAWWKTLERGNVVEITKDLGLDLGRITGFSVNSCCGCSEFFWARPVSSGKIDNSGSRFYLRQIRWFNDSVDSNPTQRGGRGWGIVEEYIVFCT
ncbi:hypothetical protein VTP01DRAFT_2934 [Rhizomucor pusillus]|uniref:uncharacterized protein n=1 Tax=Rhizomucor pusillus TaxID=4840 RepID=UPI0037447A7D